MTCEPVGAKEIAERLGVEPTAVYQWQQRGVFIDPRWTVGGRPCWNWPAVESWARRTGRIAS